jgi:hypothetical protein
MFSLLCAFLLAFASKQMTLSLREVSERGPSRVNFLKWIGDKKVRKWLWLGLAALIAIQTYYVREMLAALFIFALLFAFGAFVAFILFLFDQASQRTVEWAEPQAKRVAVAARRGLVHLEEEMSKKLPHRPVGA